MIKRCCYCNTEVTDKDLIPKTIVYLCPNKECKKPLTKQQLVTIK